MQTRLFSESAVYKNRMQRFELMPGRGDAGCKLMHRSGVLLGKSSSLNANFVKFHERRRKCMLKASRTCTCGEFGDQILAWDVSVLAGIEIWNHLVDREAGMQMKRAGGTWWFYPFKEGILQNVGPAASIVVQVRDPDGNIVELSRENCTRQQLAQSLTTGMILRKGCEVACPIEKNFKLSVLSTTPDEELVCCEPGTTIVFNETEFEQPSISRDRRNIRDFVEIQSIEAFRRVLVWPIEHYEKFVKFGKLACPRGILLHGPPGTGKSFAIHLLLDELKCQCKCKLFSFGAAKTDRYIGGKEERLRELFASAEAFLEDKDSRARSLVLLEDLDASFPVRCETSEEEESRMVATLLTLMDGLSSADQRLVVIGVTNRVNAIDLALRRPGRFDREIEFFPPDFEHRAQFLKNRCNNLDNESLQKLAHSTVGFTFADLEALIAASQELSSESLLKARKKMGPSSLVRSRGSIFRNPYERIPVEVAGYAAVRKELERAIEWPLSKKEAMKRFGLSAPRGILLHGPPGCSKTTLARSVAQSTGHSFFSLSAADVYSPFVGDAERTVREIFQSARLALPSIVFLDEIDSIVGRRGIGDRGDPANEADEASGVQTRILSTLLNEMDGFGSSEGVLVMGATNRLDMIDKALLRPGRFDKILHVPLPNEEDRHDILKLHARKLPFPDEATRANVLRQLARATHGYSGAQLENLLREAAISSVRNNSVSVTASSFPFL